MSFAIELNHVYKDYQIGQRILPVLKNINIKIAQGEMVAIMGPSGSGKTTLMNLIGLLDRPTRGEYRLNGKEIHSLKKNELPRMRGEMIGFVFQSFYLLPKLNAIENVCLPLRYQGITNRIAKERAEKILDYLGMQSYLMHKPSELSGGQQQRVAIARALVAEPHVILADEPTGALDSKIGQDIMNLFVNLNREENRTIVIITHDRNISRQCKRVIHLKDGELHSW